MNVAEQLVNQLLDAGVRRIYGIVGDSLNPVVDAVRKTGGSAKGGIDWVHVRHEEAAAFAAAAEFLRWAQVQIDLSACGNDLAVAAEHLRTAAGIQLDQVEVGRRLEGAGVAQDQQHRAVRQRARPTPPGNR